MMAPGSSLENLHLQYLRCRRNKRNTLNALRFEYHLEENLVRLQEELEGQTYEPSRSVCFVLKQPKLREIFAADFRDRVVHHVLVDALEKVWEPLFIHDSYACRMGKGTHRAVRRLQAFMRKVSCNGTRRAHFMHLDVRGFFLHINKEVLHQILARRIRDAKVLGLARTVIFHDCTRNFVPKGKKRLLEKIPPHKTLFGTQNERGLPIGNLASQFFANVYLNELDQFVKHHLKARYYIRYSDDLVLLHEEKERLQGPVNDAFVYVASDGRGKKSFGIIPVTVVGGVGSEGIGGHSPWDGRGPFRQVSCLLPASPSGAASDLFSSRFSQATSVILQAITTFASQCPDSPAWGAKQDSKQSPP